MHFKHRQQYDFVIGSLIAALVGVTLNVYQARLKEDKQPESAFQNEKDNARYIFQFGFVHHSSLALCALFSVAFYSSNLSSWVWTLSVLNLVGKLIVAFVKNFNWNPTNNLNLLNSPYKQTILYPTILALIPTPSHIKPDENIPQTNNLPVRMT